MDGSSPSQAAPSSAITTSSSSNDVSHQEAPFHILEINLISAQDLASINKSMRTYAVAWLDPNKKLSTRVDQKGNTNPKWNDKLSFRVKDKVLKSENSSLTIEIYTVSWFRDVLVGTVSVLIDNLISPFQYQAQLSKRFVALQIRRPSGYPQGILNMGFCLLDSKKQCLPLDSDLRPNDEKLNEHGGGGGEGETYQQKLNDKIQLWRSLSGNTDLTNEDFMMKPGSICNGSAVNESICNGSMVNSELNSDVGPSASIVAAEIAKDHNQHQHQQQQRQPMQLPEIPRLRAKMLHADEGSSILGELTPEEAGAKGWRRDAPSKNAQMRRNSDGGGLFSCFGNAYGIEFRIVCGASNPCNDTVKRSNSSNRSTATRRKKSGDHHSV